MQTEAFIQAIVTGCVRPTARMTPGGIAALGLVVAALLPRAWIETGPSFCPFRVWSGLPCPGCGLTRSVVALVQGDPAASLAFHPLGWTVVVAFTALALLELALFVRRRRLDQPVGSVSTLGLLERAATVRVLLVASGVVTVVWLARMPLFLSGALAI